MRPSLIPPMRALFLAMAMLALAAVSSRAEAPGSGNTFTVVATRKVEGRNIAQAKQEAVEAALSAAVDQAALSLFSSESVAREFQSYSAAVGGKAERFIDSYQIGRASCRERV